MTTHLPSHKDADGAFAAIGKYIFRDVFKSTTKLHPHQARFARWAILREQHTVYGVRGGGNFMEMGTGKTLCMLLLIALAKFYTFVPPSPLHHNVVKACRPVRTKSPSKAIHIPSTLVICPSAAQSAWISEIQRHCTKSFKYTSVDVVRDVLKNSQAKNTQWINVFQDSSYDVIFVTPETLESAWSSRGSPIASALYDVEWQRIVVDEAHRKSSKQAKTVQAIRVLNANARWVMSGTPMKNDLNGLASMYLMMGASHEMLSGTTERTSSPHVTRLYAEMTVSLTTRRCANMAPWFVTAHERHPLQLMQMSWLQYATRGTLTTDSDAIVTTPVLDLLSTERCTPSPRETHASIATLIGRWQRVSNAADPDINALVELDHPGDRQHFSVEQYWTRLALIETAATSALRQFPLHGGTTIDTVDCDAAPAFAMRERKTVHVFTRDLPRPAEANNGVNNIEWHLRNLVRLCADAPIHGIGFLSALHMLKSTSLHPDLLRINGAQLARELVAAGHRIPAAHEHTRALEGYYGLLEPATVAQASQPTPPPRSSSKKRKLEPGLASVPNELRHAHKNCVSIKMEMLQEYLRTVQPSEKVIVLDMSAAGLCMFAGYVNDRLGVPCEVITGEIAPVHDREKIISRFSDPSSGLKVLFLSLGLGAESYNTLVVANHCVLLSPWLDNTTEDQAFYRSDRPGQTKDVYRVIFQVRGGGIDDDDARLRLSAAKSLAVAAVIGAPELARNIVTVVDPSHIRTPVIQTKDTERDNLVDSSIDLLESRTKAIAAQYSNVLQMPDGIPLIPGLGYIYLPILTR